MNRIILFVVLAIGLFVASGSYYTLLETELRGRNEDLHHPPPRHAGPLHGQAVAALLARPGPHPARAPRATCPHRGGAAYIACVRRSRFL